MTVLGKNPWYNGLLLLIVFLLPLQTRLIISQGYLSGVPFEYTTRSLYLVEALIALAAIISPVISRRLKPAFLLLTGLLGWAVISLYLGTQDLSTAITHIIFAAVFAFLIYHADLKMRSIGWVVVASGSIQAIFAIWQFAAQRVRGSKLFGMAEQLPETIGVSVIEQGGDRFLRAYSLLPHPNIAAGFLLVALLFGVGLFLNAQSKKERQLVSLFLILIAAGLFFTFSRSAAVALTIGLLLTIGAIWIKQRESRGIAIRGTVLIGTTLLLLSIMFAQLLLVRVAPTTRLETQSINERTQSLVDGLEVTRGLFPFGAGFGNMPIALSRLHPDREPYSIQPAHNIYLLALAEMGIIGFGLLVLTSFAALRAIKPYILWSTPIVAAFAALLAVGWFDHYLLSFAPGLFLFWFTWAVALKASK